MAKMFYTMDEVTTKLGKSEDEVKEMVASGQIQEFRDRDKLMFKVEQIDLLAGDEDTGEVHLDLEDSSSSGSGIGLADDSQIGLADSREGTGVSIFDTGHGDEGEQTSGSGLSSSAADDDDELSLESVGSGSGLLDLTRESDDTSLGAELLEEVYSNDDNIEIPANASGLFEAAGAESPGNVIDAGGMTMPMMVESYDGSGSGLGVGFLLGAMICLVVLAIVGVVGVTGATPGLAMTMAGNIWMWVGGLAAITIICGVVGMLIGKASE